MVPVERRRLRAVRLRIRAAWAAMIGSYWAALYEGGGEYHRGAAFLPDDLASMAASGAETDAAFMLEHRKEPK